MSNTTAHTAKCLRCGRVRHFRTAEAAAHAAPHGRVCAMRVRLAAMTEAVKGFASAQVEKARELIADGGLIPTGRPGVFRAVSSKGDGSRAVISFPRRLRIDRGAENHSAPAGAIQEDGEHGTGQ